MTEICKGTRQGRWHARNPWARFLIWARDRCAREKRGRMNYPALGIKCHLVMDDVRGAWIRDGASGMVQPSLDRIDPSGDYVRANIRFLEFAENRRRAGNSTCR
jgi:hypothetical protein